MAVRFTEVSITGVTRHITRYMGKENKKGLYLFIKAIFKTEKRVQFALKLKTTFKLQKLTVLLILLIKRDLDCNDLLRNNGTTMASCFSPVNRNIYIWN